MDKDIQYLLIGAVVFLLAVLAYRYFTSESAEEAPSPSTAPAVPTNAPGTPGPGDCVEWHKKADGSGFDCVRTA